MTEQDERGGNAMELPIRNGDLVRVGENTGIDGHIARVIRVNNLAATALVETTRKRKRREVAIKKLSHCYERTNMNDFFNHIERDSETCRWKALIRGGAKIDAIKEFRCLYGAGLKEAKDVVEEYADRLRRSVDDSETRVITLGGGSELHVNKLWDGAYTLKVLQSHGTVAESELLQTVANIVRSTY